MGKVVVEMHFTKRYLWVVNPYVTIIVNGLGIQTKDKRQRSFDQT